MTGSLTGTWRLVRLAIRRDRIVLPVSMFFAWVMVGASAPALVSAYPDQESILSYIVSSAPSVVGRVFQGTVQGANIGSILMAETFLYGSLILAIMSIFIISRHTRHNEEIGAGELIGSGIVGRNAALTAAVIVAIAANIVVGLMLFATLAPMPEFAVDGAFFMAVSMSLFGILFAGISAITVQLSDYRRGANLLAISVLGGSFVIRGLGDALGNISADGLSVSASWISWLSPMGWAYQVLPFTQNRVAPLVLMAVLTFGTFALGYALLRRRDLGSSIFDTKPGPARAAQKLRSAFGLARRLQRGNLYAWLIGFVVAGALTAVIVDDFRATFEENELFAEWVASTGASGDFIKAIIATMFPLLAAMLAGFLVSAVSKMQDEETSGRLEYLLGTSLSRVRWLASHVGFTVLGTIAALLAMGAAGGLGYALAAEGSDISGWDIFLSALVSMPAMIVFLSIIVFVFARAGRFLKPFAWSYYAYCALIGSFAGIFSWPDSVSYASPFYHTPLYPADSFEWMPILVMTTLAALVLTIAAVQFRSRDLVLK